MKTIKEREDELKREFNTFWGRVFPKENNVYERIGVKGFLELKDATNDVNNIITLQVTKRFVEELYNKLGIESEDLAAYIDRLSANANGFDVYDEKYHIVAEVKCNLPSANDNKLFGGNQKEEIINDLDHLLHGKGNAETEGFYKFMVLLKYENVRGAMASILRMKPRSMEKRKLIDEIKKSITKIVPSTFEELSTEKIYLYFINLQGD